MKKGGRHVKKVPSYWWKFIWIGDDIDHIAVKSDDDRYPVLARINVKGIVPCDEQIEEAESIIKDLNAGRKKPKNLITALQRREEKSDG